MSTVWQDIRYATRTLLKNPRFSLVALMTIALGIGANSAIYSIVQGVLLAPLPVHEPERLVTPDVIGPQDFGISLSIPNFRDWREQNTTFASFAANASRFRTLLGGDRPEVIRTRWILGDWFETLGVPAAMGRLITSDMTWEGAEPVAVVTHSFWQNRMNDVANPIGEAINIEGQPFTVIGVMPEGFAFPTTDSEVFLPMGFFSNNMCWEVRGCSQGTWAIGRLADGVTMQMAQADLDRVVAGIEELEGERVGRPRLESLHHAYVGEIETQVWILMGAVGFVLLIASANVAGLLLARGEGRRREIAVRSAIGAGHGRMVRQLLTESLVLAAAGGLLGIGVGWLGIKAIMPLIADDVPSVLLDGIGLSMGVLAFTSLVTIGSGLLFGLVPALRVSRSELTHELKEGGAGGAAGRGRLRSALVVAEVALSLILLIGAGLMTKSLQELGKVDKGFDETGIFKGEISLPSLRYDEQDKVWGWYQTLRDRVAALPQVTQASVSNIVPLEGNSWENSVFPEGVPTDQENASSVLYHIVTPEHFEVFSIPLMRGRIFTEADRNGTTPVVVIDESMAEKFWPGEDPLGKRITFESEAADADTPDDERPRIYRTVVGVVKNVRHYELESPSRITLYVPMQQSGTNWSRSMTISAKTVNPEAITPAVWRIVTDLDPEVPLRDIETMSQVVNEALSPTRAVSSLLAAFGAIALLMSAIGLFGLMSLSVAQRLRDIGIRMALGAQAGDMVRMVTRQGLVVTAAGVSLGLIGAYGLTRLLSSLLFQVSPVEPVTYGSFSLFLIAVALAAAWLPARRATRVDPIRVLREE